MTNKYDNGMDDYYTGKGLPNDPTIEYLNGWSYAESLCEKDNFPEQVDNRTQPDPRDQPLE